MFTGLFKLVCVSVLIVLGCFALDGDWTHCEYGGQKFKLGESWNPDCSIRCFCMSTAVNASVCQSRCTTYTEIPMGCRLEKVDGECCPKLKCDWEDKCRSKGRWYKQDEEWDVGCDYTCKCIDASKSYYHCSAKCSTWTNIPAGCFLAPPLPGSGKCCGTMTCPGGK